MEMFYWAILPALAQALAVFVGVFSGLLLASKKLFPQNQKDPVTQSVSEIIRERYARGEISRQEYEQMKEDLLNPEQRGAGGAENPEPRYQKT